MLDYIITNHYSQYMVFHLIHTDLLQIDQPTQIYLIYEVRLSIYTDKGIDKQSFR